MTTYEPGQSVKIINQELLEALIDKHDLDADMTYEWDYIAPLHGEFNHMIRHASINVPVRDEEIELIEQTAKERRQEAVYARLSVLDHLEAGLYYGEHAQIDSWRPDRLMLSRVYEKDEYGEWTTYRGQGLPDMDSELAALWKLPEYYKRGGLFKLQTGGVA